MAAKSFIDILQDQMRADLRKEVEEEVRRELGREGLRHDEGAASRHQAAAKAGRIETWLTTHLEAAVFQRQSQGRAAYHKAGPAKSNSEKPNLKVEKSPEATEIRLHARTLEQLTALELLRRHSGARIPDSFTEQELKGAWRRAALKSHPDRFAQADATTQALASALFRELAEAYDLLARLFEANQATSKAA